MHLRSNQWKVALLAAAALAVPADEGCAEKGKLKLVDFDAAPLEEVIEYFRSGPGAAGQSRNILVDGKVDLETTVTLKLHDVSTGVAFAYVAELAGISYRDDRHALRIYPLKGKPSVATFLKRGAPMTTRRASEIMIPVIDLEEVELSTVVSDLATASRQNDPKKQGLNLILGRGVEPTTPVSLRLQNVPMASVLQYVAEAAKLNLRVDGPAIVFVNRPRKPGEKEEAAESG